MLNKRYPMSSSTQPSTCKSFSFLPVCSHHGKCNESIGKCICDNGWTSVGDFSVQPGIHCGINKVAIQVLWIIVLITSLPVVYTCLHVLYLKWLYNKKEMKQYVHDPAVISTTFYFGVSIASCVLSIAKIVDQEVFAIALHPLSTIAFYSYFTCLVSGSYMFIVILIKFVLGYVKIMSTEYKESIRAQSEIIKKFTFFILITSPITFSPPLVSLNYRNIDHTCLLVLIGVCIFVSVVIVSSLVRYVTVIAKEIGKFLDQDSGNLTKTNGADKEPLIRLKTKFLKARFALITSIIQSTALYILFLILEDLSYNSGYMWPLVIANINTLVPFMVKSMLNEPASSSSNHGRDGKDIKSEKFNKVGIEGNLEKNDVSNVSKPTSEEKLAVQVTNSNAEPEPNSSTSSKIIPGDLRKE